VVYAVFDYNLMSCVVLPLHMAHLIIIEFITRNFKYFYN